MFTTLKLFGVNPNNPYASFKKKTWEELDLEKFFDTFEKTFNTKITTENRIVFMISKLLEANPNNPYASFKEKPNSNELPSNLEELLSRWINGFTPENLQMLKAYKESGQMQKSMEKNGKSYEIFWNHMLGKNENSDAKVGEAIGEIEKSRKTINNFIAGYDKNMKNASFPNSMENASFHNRNIQEKDMKNAFLSNRNIQEKDMKKESDIHKIKVEADKEAAKEAAKKLTGLSYYCNRLFELLSGAEEGYLMREYV